MQHNCNSSTPNCKLKLYFYLFSNAHPGPQICVAIEISVAISTVAIDYVAIELLQLTTLQLTMLSFSMLQLYWLSFSHVVRCNCFCCPLQLLMLSVAIAYVVRCNCLCCLLQLPMLSFELKNVHTMCIPISTATTLNPEP